MLDSLHVNEAFTSTDAGTPAGRYLRRFWQPVYHSIDLGPGRSTPLRIMGENFALYRGESGTAILIDARCPHRGANLAVGWIEGDAVRCFYHGWKFGADGRCVQQPAEDTNFASKVAIRSYPTREYLGLIFAFLGTGPEPEFPTYPEFEYFDGFVEIDSYSRPCNYFQNLENALDMSHVGFVHSDNEASFAGIGAGLDLHAAESAWGVTYRYTRPDGQVRVQQFGMPNIFYMTALPTDPEIGWQESIFWWVPIDDGMHMQFSIHRVPATGEIARQIHLRRQARRAEIDIAHQDLCLQILGGRLRLRDVDRSRVDLVRLQDDIAQISQGRIADRENERLGRGDAGVIAIRKVWRRELNALDGGGTPATWTRTPEIVPRAWGLNDRAPALGERNGSTAAAEVVDVRPYVEIEAQLRALGAAPGVR